VLAALDRFAIACDRLRDAIANGDGGAIEAELERAAKARRRLDPFTPRARAARRRGKA